MTDIFQGTRGPQNAKVLICGEAWGQNEKEKGKPFVGASGYELEAQLKESSIDPRGCLFTNLYPDKPIGNDMRTILLPNAKGDLGYLGDGIRPNAKFIEGLQRLEKQIATVKPKLIIATGNWPLWYLTGKANVKTDKGFKVPTGIDSWRGSQLTTKYDIPALPIYHPAAILRQFTWRKITLNDLRRGASFLRGDITWYDRKESSRVNLCQPPANVVIPILHQWAKDTSTPIVCDLETKKGRIHIVGLSRDGMLNIAIPFFHITPQGFTPTYSPFEFRAIYLALHALFTTSGMKFVGQNFMYDTQYISKFFHAPIACHWDTMVGQHVAFPAIRKSLDFMSSMYCEHHRYWKDDLKESTETFDTKLACEYNCVDLWRTHEIWQAQIGVLSSLGKLPQMKRRMKVFPILVDMMNRGVRVDATAKNSQRLKLVETAEEVAEWLNNVMPECGKPKTKTHWFGSSLNLKEVLYNRMKLKPIFDKKTGAKTTNKEALVALSERYPHYAGLLSAILLLRSIRVVAGNILAAPLEVDGRIRTSYNLAGPETYRLSSSENVWGGGGNLQNIPRDREDMDLFEQDLI